MESTGRFSRFLLLAIVFSLSSAGVIAVPPEGMKLIKKVEPVYPDAAHHAHISGTVVAQVMIGPNGEVSDVRPMRGNSILTDAAIDAVWQWQYFPPYLNREDFQSSATVSVVFTAATELPISVDRFGTLGQDSSGLEGDSLIQRLVQQTKVNSNIEVVLTHDPAVPFRILDEKVGLLQSKGIHNVAASGPYIYHERRLFCLIPGGAVEPQLVVNTERLAEIVRASGRLPTVIVPNAEGLPTLLYRLFLSETGEIISVQRLRGLRGPEISEIRGGQARKGWL
jgi:TonB family protein